jgi:hypothetical protein
VSQNRNKKFCSTRILTGIVLRNYSTASTKFCEQNLIPQRIKSQIPYGTKRFCSFKKKTTIFFFFSFKQTDLKQFSQNKIIYPKVYIYIYIYFSFKETVLKGKIYMISNLILFRICYCCYTLDRKFYKKKFDSRLLEIICLLCIVNNQ